MMLKKIGDAFWRYNGGYMGKLKVKSLFGFFLDKRKFQLDFDVKKTRIWCC